MTSQSSHPIPPPGERDDYICKLNRTKPGLWILKREEHAEAFQTAISSGLTGEEAMEQVGGIFYLAPAPSIPEPSAELLEAAEGAYALLDKDPVLFLEALKTSAIEKSVWMFIMIIDPWFRPRKCGVGTLMLPGTDGPGIWVINGTQQAQLHILHNRKLGLDDEALLKEHGIYYARHADVPAEYHCPDLTNYDAATMYTLEEMHSGPSLFYAFQTL